MIAFAREETNPYDRFAISISRKTPGKIGRVVVGHIPRQLSRYMWYALDRGPLHWEKLYQINRSHRLCFKED